MTKLGITGTQQGATLRQLRAFEAFLNAHRVTEAHHGDCIGFDAEAHWLFRIHDIKIVLHPPSNDTKRAFCRGGTIVPWAKPYLERNKDIVNATDILVAAPKGFEEELRSGTWTTIRYARKQRREIHIIFPDGNVQIEKGAT